MKSRGPPKQHGEEFLGVNEESLVIFGNKSSRCSAVKCSPFLCIAKTKQGPRINTSYLQGLLHRQRFSIGCLYKKKYSNNTKYRRLLILACCSRFIKYGLQLLLNQTELLTLKIPQESEGWKERHVSAISAFLLYCHTCLALFTLSQAKYSSHTIQLASHS